MADYNRTPEAQEKFQKKGRPKGPINFKIQLNEEQKEAKETILKTPVTLLKGMAGSGKANWIKTPICTPEGYKLMGEIKPGDEVLSEEGKPIKVLDIFPQGKQDIYKITFSDGSTTHCTLDHLWNVISRDNLHRKTNRNNTPNKNYQKYQTLSLKDILDKNLKVGGRNKWFIPLNSPVEYSPKKLDLNPYILGCLLGDGCLISTPSITTTDDSILEEFKNYFSTIDLNVTPSSTDSITYYISFGKNKRIRFNGQIYNSIGGLKESLGISHVTFYNRIKTGEYIIEEIENPLIKFLKENNLYNQNSFTKHIPHNYLFSSIEDRISLLQGLLDTDGWVEVKKNKKGNSSSVFYSTSSEKLKDGIIHLVNSLGGICHVKTKLGKYKEKGNKDYKITNVNYRITIKFKNPKIESQLFRLERKQSLVKESQNIINRSISKVEFAFNDDAQCILVDSPTHLYLTDNFIVTHNTLLACQIALDQLFKKEIDKIIITRPTVSKEDIGFLPGDLKDKMDPWLSPIYANLHMLYDKSAIEKLIAEEKIEIIPLAFMRGRTAVDSVVIVDECQNLTHNQTEMILGRLGKNSQMIFCGDMAQIDLKSKKESGISFFTILEAKTKESKTNSVKIINLEQNHRHPAVEGILKIYSDYRD